MTPVPTVWSHSLWMLYCRGRDAAIPSASSIVPWMATGGSSASPPPPRRIKGRVAPGLWDPVVPSGAEPPCVEGCGVPSDVRVARGQLVDTQGQRLVWTGRRVIVERDLSPGNGAPPGLQRRQLPRHWAPTLMHH